MKPAMLHEGAESDIQVSFSLNKRAAIWHSGNVMISQNVLFVGEPPESDPDAHPPGEGIAQVIATGLRELGFQPNAIDNWRDCGWSLDLSVDQVVLQIALAATAVPKTWMLQVACMNQPGFLARLFGANKVDASKELFDVASAIHQILLGAGYSNLRWCVDGYPDDGKNTPEPRQQ